MDRIEQVKKVRKIRSDIGKKRYIDMSPTQAESLQETPQVVCLEPNSTLGCLPTNEFRFTKKGFTNRTGKFPSPSTPTSEVVCKNNPCSIRPDCPSLKPHTKNNGCVDNEECPDCIPVPSTLNEEITGGIKINGKLLVGESTPASVSPPPDELLGGYKIVCVDDSPMLASETLMYFVEDSKGKRYSKVSADIVDKMLQAQLLKCHQSEAARIKQLELLAQGRLELHDLLKVKVRKQEARIKELEKKLELSSLAEDIVRADQNRKIKDWLKKNPQYKLMKKTSRCGKWYENLLDSDWNILLSELSELKENK